MKLRYSILWFDDDKDQFDSHDFTDLISEINSLGFDFDGPVYVQTAQEFIKQAPFSDFDLIVVDYNIDEEGKHGHDFIQEVRNHNVYAEIVFYTAFGMNELWDGVKEKQLDGVFLSNAKEITRKVAQVFRQSVKKVVDLENMRGIVMAQVGDMDNIMKNLLKEGLDQIKGEDLDSIYKNFIAREKSFGKGICRKAQKFSNAPSIEEMLNLCNTSYPIWSLAKDLIERHPSLQGFDISEYENEIIKPRNILAHGVPRSQKKGTQFFVHKKDEFEYSEESAKKIRENLRKYGNIYENMLNQISSKPSIE